MKKKKKEAILRECENYKVKEKTGWHLKNKEHASPKKTVYLTFSIWASSNMIKVSHVT